MSTETSNTAAAPTRGNVMGSEVARTRGLKPNGVYARSATNPARRAIFQNRN